MGKEGGRTYALRGFVMWLITTSRLNDNATVESLLDKSPALRSKSLNEHHRREQINQF